MLQEYESISIERYGVFPWQDLRLLVGLFFLLIPFL